MMEKLLASLKKEALIFLNDKVALLLLYLMPVALVFIITLIQDSSFRMASGGRIRVLVVNDDEGPTGDSLVGLLGRSGAFELSVTEQLHPSAVQRRLLDEDRQLAIHIPRTFSDELEGKAARVSDKMLQEFGVKDSATLARAGEKLPLTLYYDPVLQESNRLSIANGIRSYLGALESALLLKRMYAEMGYPQVPAEIRSALQNRETTIRQVAASGTSGAPVPNATQHNVPAWSIFAMFFMVVSLGGNIVKERLNGSYTRLRTIPDGFRFVLLSKMLVYLFVALTQLLLIFAIGMTVFPLIGLPQLELPASVAAVLVVSVLSGLAAVSYAVLVGTYARTLEQANGFGAISIILFAAIGGIWVPAFVMPAYLQSLGQFSPLYWCLKGFYALFLQGGSWKELRTTVMFLLLFSACCQVLIVAKLKIRRYL